jgi:hypothetical protein
VATQFSTNVNSSNTPALSAVRHQRCDRKPSERNGVVTIQTVLPNTKNKRSVDAFRAFPLQGRSHFQFHTAYEKEIQFSICIF